MPAGPRPAPPNRTVKLVYIGDFEDAQWMNVMWLFLTGSGEITQDDMDELAQGCASSFTSFLLPQLSTQATLVSVTCELQFNDEVITGLYNDGGSGTRSGDTLPANVAACISWRTRARYRGGHARTYLCGLTSDLQVTPTTWDGIFVAALASDANDFHTDLEGFSSGGSGIDTVEHGIVSFVDNNDWREPPVFRRIFGATVDTRIDTQRRRLGRDRIS